MQAWQPLPWQSQLWQQLVHCNQSDNLAHAYLLRGMPGVGKEQFARAFAAYLLCKSPVNDQACGFCKECELLKAGSHPDIAIVEPDDPGRPIRIDRVRQLNEFAHKTAQQGGRRVIIINPAEAMNINASNALLKCLEEPGENTVFLLVSARAGDMLPTIRSRCQQLKFATPDRLSAELWLSEHLENHADQVAMLLDQTADAPLEAKRFADEGLLEKRLELAHCVKGLFKGAMAPVELAKEWQKGDLVLTLTWLISWLEDSVRLEQGVGESEIRNTDQVKMLSYIATKVSGRAILEERDWLIKQRQSLLEGGNLNGQILMEGAFSRYLELVL